MFWFALIALIFVVLFVFKYKNNSQCKNSKVQSGFLNVPVKLDNNYSTPKPSVNVPSYWSYRGIRSTDSFNRVAERRIYSFDLGHQKPLYSVLVGGYESVNNYVVVDIETTGLHSSVDDIIQLSAVKFKNDKVVGKYNRYLCPSHSISNFIVNLTGITNDMVANQPCFLDIVDEFRSFVGDLPWVGHNIERFDIPFMCSLGYSQEEIKCIDTWLMAKHELNRDFLVNLKLPTLKEHYRINLPSHNAFDDCLTCGYVYQHLRDERFKVKAQHDSLHGVNIYQDSDFSQIQTNELRRFIHLCGGRFNSKLRNTTNVVLTMHPDKFVGNVNKRVFDIKSFFKWVDEQNFVDNSSVLIKPLGDKHLKSLDYSFCFSKETALMLKEFNRRVRDDLEKCDSRMINTFRSFYDLGDFAHDWVLMHNSVKDYFHYFLTNHKQLSRDQIKVAQLELLSRIIRYVRRCDGYSSLYDRVMAGSNNRTKSFINDSMAEVTLVDHYIESLRNRDDKQQRLYLGELQRKLSDLDKYRSYVVKLTNNATAIF